jgi:phosphoribosylanthranilate isomerase
MSVELKVCGMRDPANIAEVAALQPDYMGFIFYEKSPRFVGDDFEMPAIPVGIKKVGVFVNETTEAIVNKVNRYKLDFVQLHGNESSAQCLDLKDQGVKIIKAFSVDKDFKFESVEPYANFVSYFLFDTKGKYFGGNATTFDWSLLQQYSLQIPFFLSGGISIDNVSDIHKIGTSKLHSIDVNSGVERSAGVKDLNKIKDLKRAVSSW